MTKSIGGVFTLLTRRLHHIADSPLTPNCMLLVTFPFLFRIFKIGTRRPVRGVVSACLVFRGPAAAAAAR